ncbi:hypothetical protein Q0590_19020 [Rhodocytophaga aerolata]|uniref:Uncharacterized protein n=1 Tax=Rhodocytophaga aerolata TaxID=455078 RepID=A0ABT8R9K0_9BACT|nr:hypothetical protein [Rhodocytophaga aerolata]
MITALPKAALYNLWYKEQACADGIQRYWQGGACPALEDKHSLFILLLRISTLVELLDEYTYFRR